ncbi:FG-GAP repeat [Comamonadaceae bacterium]
MHALVTPQIPASPQASNRSQKSRGILWASAALVCAAVTACGGGGGAGVSGNTTNTGNTNTNTDNTSIAGSWAPQAYAKASNAAASDSFGTSVAISDDTMVVGAPGEDSNQTTITNGSTASTDNSASSAGAAYVFVRSGSAWIQQAYLKAPNAGVSDNFGSSIAISGDTVVVGAPLEESNQTTITNGSTASTDNSASSAGAAYVFVRSGNTWSQQAYLKAPNAEALDNFGSSIAISGDTVVVGAELEASNQTTITNGSTASTDNSASSAGAAYVFVRSGSTWSQQAYLKASNAGGGDFFAASIAISGDTIVVGANAEDSSQTTITNGTAASADNTGTDAGAAYVFVRSGSTWSQQAYLKAPNAQATDRFGTSVGISGDTIVVGAQQEDSNQTTITNGGTASSDNTATNAGAAYVFVRSGSTWSQQAYLKASNAELGDNFGQSVGISGNTIVVGADGEDSALTSVTNGNSITINNAATDSGAAYVFTRSGTTWSQQAYLKAPNVGSNDNFGAKVGISGHTIVAGAVSESSNQNTITNGNTASADNTGNNAGAAYVFSRN